MLEMTYSQFLSYKFVITNFHQKLESLEHLNDVLPRLYQEYYESESEKLKHINIPKSEFDIIINIGELVKKDDFTGMSAEIAKLSPESFEVLRNSIQMLSKKHETNQFLRQMTIAYLITIFEDFLKKILKLVFFYSRETLKSGSMMNYKTIIELKTYDAIIENMIEEKAKEIIDKSISDLGKSLEKDFDFSLIHDDDWEKFAEVFYRRHAIVHNNGLPDENYKLRTGNTTITDLMPTEDYIKQTIGLFQYYSVKIYDFFSEKYPVRNLL